MGDNDLLIRPFKIDLKKISLIARSPDARKMTVFFRERSVSLLPCPCLSCTFMGVKESENVLFWEGIGMRGNDAQEKQQVLEENTTKRLPVDDTISSALCHIVLRVSAEGLQRNPARSGHTRWLKRSGGVRKRRGVAPHGSQLTGTDAHQTMSKLYLCWCLIVKCLMDVPLILKHESSRNRLKYDSSRILM